MKKYYKIHEVEIPNFVAIDLIENDKTVGGYIVQRNGYAKKEIIDHLKKEGYREYEKDENNRRCF